MRRGALLVLIASAAAGCNGSSHPPHVAGVCGNSYQPSNTGVRWHYRTASAAGTFTSTATVTFSNPARFTITTRSRGSTQVVGYRCDGGDITALAVPGVDGSVLAGGAHHAFVTTSVSGITLPLSPRGKTWRQSFRVHGGGTVNGVAEGLEGSVATRYTAARQRAPVTVPAGTFSALKITELTRFDLTVTVRGVSVPVQTLVHSTVYMAPGVGLVRSVSTGSLLGAQLGSQTVLLDT